MQRELNNIINSFDGKVLAINISSDLASKLEQNNNIIQCYMMDSSIGKGKGKKGKTIKIKKIGKKFKKKKIDYIICEYEGIKKYLNTFIKDSVYINSNKLYFYGNVDIDLIKKRYGRYDTDIVIKQYKDNYIVCIDNSKSKNNFIKDLCYRIMDNTNSLIEYIGDILMG